VEIRAEVSLRQTHLSLLLPKGAHIIAVELHGFSDASEHAYIGVVYLYMIDSDVSIHLSIVTSNMKVAPNKRLMIPHLELCGTHLLTQHLHHVKPLTTELNVQVCLTAPLSSAGWLEISSVSRCKLATESLTLWN
jgi:hypothetical protein